LSDPCFSTNSNASFWLVIKTGIGNSQWIY
jgi:hypothetical protein